MKGPKLGQAAAGETMPSSATFKTVFSSLVIVLAASALAIILFKTFPFLRAAENWVADLRVATLSPAEVQHPDIVIVAVTEDTLATLSYRSPLDRAFLADLVRAVDAAAPRAIGLDILLDQPTETAKDEALRAAIGGAKAPLVIAWADEADGLTERQTAFLLKNFGEVPKGYVNLLSDSADGAVRWVFPGKASSGGWVSGFAGALAQAAGAVVSTETLVLAFRPGPKRGTPAFRIFPAHTLKFLPKTWLAGKVVLIGADLPHGDRHRTPLSAGAKNGAGLMPGLNLHAHAVAQMLDGRTAPNLKAGWEWSAVFLLAVLGILIARVDLPVVLKGAGAVAGLALFWVGGFALFGWGGVLIPLAAPSAGFLFAGAVGSAYLGRQERAKRKFIRTAFSKFISPAVVDQMVADPSRLELGGERRDVTCLFTDLAGFTSMVEKSDPAVVLPLLNEYFEGMCRIAFDHGGTIDKIVGDALHVMFNAPLDQADHAERAVACASDMDEFANAFVVRQRERGFHFGLTRIGVNSGNVVVGNFGGEVFFDYTAHGDAINTAARLESVNKHLGTRVCVAGSTASQCPDLKFRPIGKLVLKGKTEGIDTFEPLSSSADQEIDVDAYENAFRMMADGNSEAAYAFDALAGRFPDDKLSLLHARRLSTGEKGITIVLKEK